MDNTKVKSREVARIIGKIDFILTTLILFIWGRLFYVWVQQLVLQGLGLLANHWFNIFSVTVGLLCTVLKIYAANILLKATEKGRPLDEARRLTYFWLIVNTLIFIALLVVTIWTHNWGGVALNVVFKVAFIWTAQWYETEIIKVMRNSKSSSAPAPSSNLDHYDLAKEVSNCDAKEASFTTPTCCA